jgi:hypothetical protein
VLLLAINTHYIYPSKMKKIKYPLLITACLLMGLALTAQDKFEKKLRVGVGISLAVPTNNLAYTSIGGGIDLIAIYPLSQAFALTADVGYTGLKGKYNIPFTGIIPIRAGVRYYPAEQFYLSGKAGLGLYTLGNVSQSYAAYSVGAGAEINKRWDAGLSYDGYSNDGSFGYLAVRLGYYFGKK